MTDKNKPSDLCGLLEVSPRAGIDVINAAYKVLMKRHYPDGIKGDERIALQLNSAKEILVDPVKRKIYNLDRENLAGKKLQEYNVLEVIAEGGFGKTYKAKHTLLDELVCIKHAHYVSPQDEDLLIKEAKAIWDLRHYSIPSMRDVIRTKDGSLALVMSYIPGKTLTQILEKVGKLDPEHVAWITERSLNALKYLHYNGVVHGDVKPSNIIVQPETHMIVLVDYGLSLIRPTSGSTTPGFTPDFAPPEQVRGETLVPESDLYSLGLTMIKLLGGDVKKRNVPSYVPDSMCNLIKKFIKYEVKARPNWQKEDLMETIQQVRLKEFGRTSSGMRPIEGVD